MGGLCCIAPNLHERRRDFFAADSAVGILAAAAASAACWLPAAITSSRPSLVTETAVDFCAADAGAVIIVHIPSMCRVPGCF